jgi:hypothetical protein
VKLRQIGLSYSPLLDGVVLTPEEYLRHPAYRAFGRVEATRLWVRAAGGEWGPVPPDRASGYALLEATDDERRQLAANGYRLLNL